MSSLTTNESFATLSLPPYLERSTLQSLMATLGAIEALYGVDFRFHVKRNKSDFRKYSYKHFVRKYFMAATLRALTNKVVSNEKRLRQAGLTKKAKKLKWPHRTEKLAAYGNDHFGAIEANLKAIGRLDALDGIILEAMRRHPQPPLPDDISGFFPKGHASNIERRAKREKRQKRLANLQDSSPSLT